MLNNALISDFVLTDNVPQYQNQTWAGEIITRVVGTQYFSLSFKVTINKKYRAELMNFYALYSSGRPFDMPLGWWSTYTGTQTSNIQITAARAAGSTSLQVNNNTLEVGSIVQIGGAKKLYRVIANSGTNMTIFPALLSNVQAGSVVNYNNLQGSFILTPQNSGYQMPSNNVIEVTIQATENIRG